MLHVDARVYESEALISLLVKPDRLESHDSDCDAEVVVDSIDSETGSREDITGVWVLVRTTLALEPEHGLAVGEIVLVVGITESGVLVQGVLVDNEILFRVDEHLQRVAASAPAGLEVADVVQS